MKNSHNSLWIADDMQPMLQCGDGSSPTVTARCGNAGIVNMLDLAHYPIQGVLVIGHYPDQGVVVQGHYEETDTTK